MAFLWLSVEFNFYGAKKWFSRIYTSTAILLTVHKLKNTKIDGTNRIFLGNKNVLRRYAGRKQCILMLNWEKDYIELLLLTTIITITDAMNNKQNSKPIKIENEFINIWINLWNSYIFLHVCYKIQCIGRKE